MMMGEPQPHDLPCQPTPRQRFRYTDCDSGEWRVSTWPALSRAGSALANRSSGVTVVICEVVTAGIGVLGGGGGI